MSTIINTNARRYPSFGTGHQGLILLAVLCEAVDGYRVYEGIVPDNSLDDPEYNATKHLVQGNGVKCTYDRAKQHFPGLESERYTR